MAPGCIISTMRRPISKRSWKRHGSGDRPGPAAPAPPARRARGGAWSGAGCRACGARARRCPGLARGRPAVPGQVVRAAAVAPARAAVSAGRDLAATRALAAAPAASRAARPGRACQGLEWVVAAWKAPFGLNALRPRWFLLFQRLAPSGILAIGPPTSIARARVAELVNAAGLGPVVERCGGSSPSARTMHTRRQSGGLLSMGIARGRASFEDL